MIARAIAGRDAGPPFQDPPRQRPGHGASRPARHASGLVHGRCQGSRSCRRWRPRTAHTRTRLRHRMPDGAPALHGTAFQPLGRPPRRPRIVPQARWRLTLADQMTVAGENCFSAGLAGPSCVHSQGPPPGWRVTPSMLKLSRVPMNRLSGHDHPAGVLASRTARRDSCRSGSQACRGQRDT